MNRLTLLTAAAVIAAAIAVFDLVSAWTLQMDAAAFAVNIGLFVFGIAIYGALLVLGIGQRRRIMAAAANPAAVIAGAASGIRWNALAAIALSVLLFANCSASISSGPPNYAGPMNDISGFLKGGAAVFLPVLVVIALVAVLSTFANVYATRRQWRSARYAAQAAIWSVVAIAIIAVLTVPVGFIFLVSQCFFGTNQGACAAGGASFTNVSLGAAFALLLPYTLLMMRALRSAGSQGSDSSHPD